MLGGLIVLLLGAAAHAADLQITWQGRLLDAAGGVVSGSRDVTVALFPQESGGSAVWSRTYAGVGVADGYVAVQLAGADDTARALDGVDFGAALWVELAVDGTTLSPRQALGAVPRAANVGARGDGTSVDRPAASCQALKTAGDTSGFRWVDPNGGSVHDAYLVYCEQGLADGGWNVCAGFDPSPDDQRGRRIPATIFTEKHGNLALIDGYDDRYWGSNCAQLYEDLGGTQVLLRTSIGSNVGGDWWALQGPTNLGTWESRGNVNVGSLDDATTVIATNTSWGNGTARVNWSGDCTWGTCAKQWHLLENSAVSCGADQAGGGGINVPVTEGCTDSTYAVSCGVGASADTTGECNNQWVWAAVR